MICSCKCHSELEELNNIKIVGVSSSKFRGASKPCITISVKYTRRINYLPVTLR